MHRKDANDLQSSIEEPSTYQKALEESSVIIDTVVVFSNPDPVDYNRKLLNLIADLSKKYNQVTRFLCLELTSRIQKKRYIYTSGVLVYGDSATEVDETVNPASKLLQFRTKFENEVTTNKDVDGVVLRPGFTYGGAGGTFANGFS